MSSLPYLAHYPEALQAQVRTALAQGRLADGLRARYPEIHEVRPTAQEFDNQSRFLRQAEPLSKVVYDQRLHVIRNALGTHTAVSRVQGNRLKAKREIRVASLFKEAPAAFLKMIVVHELAHLKEREHGKAFYALCTHMTPDYHQLEFDLRVWLTVAELPQPDRIVPSRP